MRSLLYFAIVAIAAAASIDPAVAAEVAPTQAATNAYRQGQAYERLFQDISVMPGICGIVLEREQCNADLATNLALRPAAATDAGVQKWFATGDMALQVNNWNGSYIPESTWQRDPAFAWWYNAGIVSIAASMPQGAGSDTYLGSYANVLDEHASLAPGGADAWLFPGATPYARTAVLQGKLEAVFPVETYPAAQFGSGDLAYAQLGVYVSTLAQLLDNVIALSRPESRAFAKATLARLQQAHQQFDDGLSATASQALVDQPIVADPAWVDAHWRQPLLPPLNTKWPKPQRQAFLIGMAVAQLAYNAAVLKFPKSDSEFRGAAERMPPWSGISAKTRSDISALFAIPSVAKGGKWEDINAAATTATLDIAKGT
jgi:hypothetical protein